MPKVGILWGGNISDVSDFRDAFRKELRDLGKVEGSNLDIEERHIKGSPETPNELAAQLVAASVDVIVTSGTPAAQTARDATKDIPIVFAAVGDPDLVKAANITGVRLPEPQSSCERVKILSAAIPGLKTVAVLWNEANPVHQRYFDEIQKEVVRLKLGVESLRVKGRDEIENVLNGMTKSNPLIVCPDPMFHSYRSQILSFALTNRVPAIYSQRSYVEEGGLMSYGPNYPDMFRQIAAVVNSILDSNKLPPLQEVMSSELVINLSTARRIGCTIAESVRARATLIN